METILLDLTPHQRRKLRKGLQFQIKHSQVGTGASLLMCPTKVKKIHKAVKRSKGSRLKLSPEEMEASGIKQNTRATTTPSTLPPPPKIKPIKPIKLDKKPKPLVRKALAKALQVGLPLATASLGFPEFAPVVAGVAGQFADKAVNALGDKVGFGNKSKKYFKLADNYSTFVPPSHPAQNPTIVSMETQGLPKRTGRGAPISSSQTPAMNPTYISMETTGKGRKRGGSFRTN